MELDPLLAVEHHHGVHLHRAAEVQHRGEGGDHGEGRQHLEIALVGELELVHSGADAERVEDDVALGVGVRHGPELFPDGRQIDRHAQPPVSAGDHTDRGARSRVRQGGTRGNADPIAVMLTLPVAGP